MKTSSGELKKRAKLSLFGHYGTVVGALLMVSLAILVAGLVWMGAVTPTIHLFDRDFEPAGRWFFGNVLRVNLTFYIVSLLAQLFLGGIVRMLYNLSVGQACGLGDLLFAFTHKPHRFLGIYLINIVCALLLEMPYLVVRIVASITEYLPVMVTLRNLMYLLFIVGSLVYYLCFGLTVIILVENPEKKVLECFRESAAVMRGNKGRLFYLQLSFIGMVLLGIGSFGIGFLWISPYWKTTLIHFYLDLKAEQWREVPFYYEDYYEETEAENGYGGEYGGASPGDPACP